MKTTTSAKSKTKEYGIEESKLMKLFEDELKDIYWAEKALTKALPKMAKNATAPELVAAINSHLTETEGQIEKLEQVFEILGKKPVAKKCEAMAGLVKEAGEIMENTDKGGMRDAGVVFCQLKKFYPGAEIAMRSIEYDNEEFTKFMENSLTPPKKSRERFNSKAKNSPAAEKLMRQLNEL